MQPHDFIAIGDTVVDAFIKLNKDSAHIDIDHEQKELAFKFGDKVPYEEMYVLPAVGNSANAAVAAARLGVNAAIISSVGGDQYGKECIAQFESNGVSTDYVKTHEGMRTNYHYVLWYDAERTILIKHEAYPYALPEMTPPKWLYLSSLGAHGKDFHTEIAAYLGAHPEVQLAFQPGTFQMSLGTEFLHDLYQRTALFFCNKEEAARILNIETSNVRALLEGLRALGPQRVVITDGPDGAYATDGTGFWFLPPYPDPKPPYERTGAGDAFASTVTAAMALGVSFEEALRWGPINSMSVVQKVGAQEGLLPRAELEALLAQAPSTFILTPLA